MNHSKSKYPKKQERWQLLPEWKARKLQELSYEERQAILYAVADALVDSKDKLLEANMLDLKAAKEGLVALPLVRRLKVTEEKLSTLAAGI